MNQTRKNVRSTKKHENVELTQTPRAPNLGSADAVLSRGEYGRQGEYGRKSKTTAFEEPNTSKLKGRKARDVYTKVYDVRNTVFSDQTGQFPTRSQSGNKYLMVMVEIDSNAILVEPLKSRKDPELARAYRAMMLRLKQAGIVP